jgi:hypothetical protein
MTGPESVTDWLASRDPAPPRELASRIAAMAPRATELSRADELLDAGEVAMRTVLHEGCLTRSSALDLLAVDAIVTYAFEAAADDPDQLEERAAEALARIAALAAPYEA